VTSPALLHDAVPRHALIGGEWARGARRYSVQSAATGSMLSDVADCGADDARRAADAAVAAFPEWSRRTAYERSTILRRWRDLILANEADLGRTMALEMGKPVTEARGEARYAAGFVEFYADEAKRIGGDAITSHDADKRLFAFRKPVGPTIAITPWNFPAAMLTRKAAPALAAGCTMIVKPAEQTPFTALWLASLWLEAGGPPGTLQVLPCLDPVPVAAVLLADARLRKISFTGSTEVGMRLYAQAATTMKRLSLELGGHAPFIVFEDADVSSSVREVMASKFRNAGQTCVCANRIYVHDAVRREFTASFEEAVRALRVGDPLDPDTQVGPLVDEAGATKVASHVADAIAHGATASVGGARGDRTFFAPTVLTGAHAGMLVLREETFGPVAPIVAFSDDADAIRQANDVPVGLAAYVWTRDLGRAFRATESLEYGIVGVNDGLPSTPQAPFGGVKFSGLGREGGAWGIDEYLDTQFVSMRLPTPRTP
jgi:succinate-semialdehyde dehydrogenase/glutarate-semialdehyde dehydrogenase